MYNTVKEMHIALDFGLQHIDSNRKQSILPEYKDLALNYAVLQFIETRISAKSNRRQEGLEDTSKRYDDLKDLKRVHKGICYKGNITDKVVRSILPFDYYRYISIGANIHFNKFELPLANVSTNSTYKVVEFTDTDNSYNGFRIGITSRESGNVTYFNSNDYGIGTLHGKDSKFIIVNLVLQEFNTRLGIECYWENYNDKYYPNSFIFVSANGFSITVNSITKSGVEYNNVKLVYSNIAKDTKPSDIVSSDIAFLTTSSYYHMANEHLRPRSILRQGYVEIKEGNNFVVPEYIIEYYKKPRLINYKLNQSCEIQVNREIVDLAIQRLKAYIKDEGYQHIVNENQIIE
jgi:hypothetical protein